MAGTVQEFLGGPSPLDHGSWAFDFGMHLASAWGTTYGGATGAACVAVARELAPGLSPRSLHLQFVRQVPAGRAVCHGRVVHAGRSVTTVEVQFVDERDRPALLGQLTLVNSESLLRDRVHVSSPEIRVVRTLITDRTPWASPVAEFFSLPVTHWVHTDDVPRSITGEAAYAGSVHAPWSDHDGTGAEFACLIADMCNGGAICHGMRDVFPDRVAFPNTDLSLRFTGIPGTSEAIGTSQLLSVYDGTTIVSIAIHSTAGQLAHGLAASVLSQLPPQ